jgi:hypothetical protein
VVEIHAGKRTIGFSNVRRPGAPGVAGRRLDLDHVRAQPSHQFADGLGSALGEIQDEEVAQAMSSLSLAIARFFGY